MMIMLIVLLCSSLLTQVGGFELKFDLRRPRLKRLVLAEVDSHLQNDEKLDINSYDDQN